MLQSPGAATGTSSAREQVRELGRVGDRLIPVAVVYARLNAVLTCDFAAPSKASGRSYRNIPRLGYRRRARGSWPPCRPVEDLQIRRLETGWPKPATHSSPGTIQT